MPNTGIVYDSFMRKHDPGPGHPEQPERYSAVFNHLEAIGTIDLLRVLKPRAASEEDLALAHSPKYIELAKQEVAMGRSQLSTGDTSINKASFDCARVAAGCVMAAVDAVVDGSVENAFCLVRPPGHHAEYARGMGFCLFNNAAVAARYAQHRHGIGRVLIVDWDVHHGNGTQQIFYDDPSVLFCSTHQWPWYPGTGAQNETGEGAGEGFTINCPLPAGSGRAEVLGAFRAKMEPAVLDYRPELVLISAGFDSRIDDPLGRFTLEDRDFDKLTRTVLSWAAESARGHVISVLEGGYNLSGLASAVKAHVRALAGCPEIN
jgi:acetoin utilization deacetylase AcuC-like enzyme